MNAPDAGRGTESVTDVLASQIKMADCECGHAVNAHDAEGICWVGECDCDNDRWAALAASDWLARSLAQARAEGAQAVVEAVEALDAELIADDIDSRWGTDHAHRIAARRVVDYARAAAQQATTGEVTL